MTAERDRKLTLSDPGRDAAGDELELMLEEAERDEAEPAEDSGPDSFLDRLPRRPRERQARR